MNGQSLVLLAVGLFAALVVTVATVNQRLLAEHPASEASGLLWRVERALNAAQDIELDLSSTDYARPNAAVRMVVRVLVNPIPVLSVEYVEPESLRGQVVTVENDLLSHYIPEEDLVVVKRWTGVPLAAVGLAGLDVSGLRSELQRGSVTARVLGDTTSLSVGSGADFPFDVTLAGTSLDSVDASDESSLSMFDPDLRGFATSSAGGDFLRTSYVIEVRNAESGQLTRALWIDRSTFLIQKVVYFENDQRVRAVDVESIQLNQGLTADEVLVRPRASVTIRG